MRGVLFVLLIATASLPIPASAQQWSPQQQEVLQHIQACWDAWATKDFDRWVNVCRPAEGFTSWSTVEGAPRGLDFWRKLMRDQGDVVWNEKRPLAIQIERDIAIVFFYSLWKTTVGGESVVSEQKRMEVFRKSDGRWSVLSSMIAPTTATAR